MNDKIMLLDSRFAPRILSAYDKHRVLKDMSATEITTVSEMAHMHLDEAIRNGEEYNASKHSNYVGRLVLNHAYLKHKGASRLEDKVNQVINWCGDKNAEIAAFTKLQQIECEVNPELIYTYSHCFKGAARHLAERAGINDARTAVLMLGAAFGDLCQDLMNDNQKTLMLSLKLFLGRYIVLLHTTTGFNQLGASMFAYVLDVCKQLEVSAYKLLMDHIMENGYYELDWY